MNLSDGRNIVNCLSIDVEGFIESNLQSFYIAENYRDKVKEKYEIETNINFILQLLSDMDVSATFFFLGRLAQDIPHLVRTVAQCGHEIACHSYEHIRIFMMRRDDFRFKVEYAKKCLEDVSGSRVYGFRAPDFSITASSIWALDILKETGFLYDSSIYPVDIHDVYGIKGIEPFIHELPNGLIEVPLSSVGFLWKRFPFGGGGYFRLYPLLLTRLCIARLNKLGHPCIFYIHPYEVGPEIPRIKELSYYRKFRHYYNCDSGFGRLRNLLLAFKFSTAINMLRSCGLIKETNNHVGQEIYKII